MHFGKLTAAMGFCVAATLAGCSDDAPKQSAAKPPSTESESMAERYAAYEAEEKAAEAALKDRKERLAKQAKLDADQHKKHTQVALEDYKPLDAAQLSFLHVGFSENGAVPKDKRDFDNLVSALVFDQKGEGEVAKLALDYLSTRDTFAKKDMEEKLIPIIKSKLEDAVKNDRYVVLTTRSINLRPYDFDNKGFNVKQFSGDEPSSTWRLSLHQGLPNSDQQRVNVSLESPPITFDNYEKFRFIPVDDRGLAAQVQKVLDGDSLTSMRTDIYLFVKGMRNIDAEKPNKLDFVADVVKVRFSPSRHNGYESVDGETLLVSTGMDN